MAKVNESQVSRVADVIARLPETRGLNFYSYHVDGEEVVATDMYPPLHHPHALDFFFFACMHQFGFWYGDERGYRGSMAGVFGGKPCKGSDMVWKSLMRYMSEEPDAQRPERLAFIGHKEMWGRMFTDDNGPIRFPDMDRRRLLTLGYGRWFVYNRTSPGDLVRCANESASPLKVFLGMARQICGYAGDPFDKKLLLLAMALANRPERFLHVTDPDSWRPIIDYHLMRVALRLGMVELEQSEIEANKARAWVSFDVEAGIRHAAYRAFTGVLHESGRSLSLVDEVFWMARKYCPDMKEPSCDKCRFSGICAKRSDLFQPVFRTTYY